MTTAVSQVGIYNRALQRLGAGRLTSVSQDHKNARSCTAAYDFVRRRLLRRYAWGFAKKRASVSKDASATTWGSLNKYAKPNDFIRLLRYRDERVDWEIEGAYIITADASPLQFRYIYDVEDTGAFDPYFAELLACLLAYEICEDVTGSVEKRKVLAADFQMIEGEAMRANAFEKDADVPLEDDFILAMR